MASEDWSELVVIHAKTLPRPLLDVLGLDCGAWLCLGDAGTEFQQMPPLDMSKGFKVFASLGRCSVATGLYMAGQLKQMHYSRDSTTKLKRGKGRISVLGHLEAGYHYLLSDTYVVPHQFHTWWRLVHPLPRLGKDPLVQSNLPMPPVQNLGIDGVGVPNFDPPPARRPWLPHQCRSLRWMVYREAVRDLFVCESSTGVPAGIDPLQLEWKMDKAFDLRGGVLCDPVGSGKTATMLGLILYDSCAAQWKCEVDDVVSDLFESSWLIVNATLVICPDHVHEQWVQEVERALKDDALEVVPIRTVSELRASSMKLKSLTEDATPDQRLTVVIVALSLVQDSDYAELISPSNQDIKTWLQGTDKWKQGLALDCFVWRRLIVDEIHEIVHVCSERCSMECPHAALVNHLRALKSERRWGLTGTAQEVLRDPKAVQNLAQIFRTDFNSEVSSRRFIEHYCRTNQVEAPVRVKEELVLIDQTPPERLIYQQHARDFSTMGVDGTGENPISSDELTAVVPLLKLCSHFKIDELKKHMELVDGKLPVLTASDIACSIYNQKSQAVELSRDEVDKLCLEENAVMESEDAKPEAEFVVAPAALLADEIWAEPKLVHGELKVIVTRVEAGAKVCRGLHVGDMVTAVGGKPVFDFAQRLQELRVELEEQHMENPPEDALQLELRDLEMRQHLREAFRAEILRHAGPSGSVCFAWRPVDSAKALGATYLCKQKLLARHTRWNDATSSFMFMSGLWEALCATGRTLRRNCPVCLEDFDAGRAGSVLRCGHLYCSDCSGKMFGSARGHMPRTRQWFCPLCRSPVRSVDDIVDLKEFASGRERAESMAALEADADNQHGSKLAVVARVLRDILARKDERAIVFCQFADLELQISHALSELKIAHARLSAAKDIFEQTSILDSFQQGRGRHRVLLLSLEQSASGTNLTAANHVLLVHPMAASTAERAVAFEQQAIGRCVRLGQKRVVTVWRFITRGTVEELLDRRFADQRLNHSSGSHPLARAKASRRPPASATSAVSAVSAAAAAAADPVAYPARDEPGGSGREAAVALRGPRSSASRRGSRASSGGPGGRQSRAGGSSRSVGSGEGGRSSRRGSRNASGSGSGSPIPRSQANASAPAP